MYRMHVMVYDGDAKRLSLARLRREMVGLTRDVGTRHGAPGLWIRGYRDKADFRHKIWTIRTFALNTGYSFRYFATNQKSKDAVWDLVSVERG